MSKLDSDKMGKTKIDNPLLMLQVTSIQQKFMMPQEVPAPPVFERPKAYGWHSVVFPNVHDENTILELWLDRVYKWLNERNIKAYFWCYAHGVEKKQANRISPVFFFKDDIHAAAMMWLFNGELVPA